MDFKRLGLALLQRLAPVYIATVLWSVTDYFAFVLGGVALSILMEVTWPLLRPLCEVLYEELTAQHAEAQARRRAALLKTFLPFFQAYKTVLTAYPPALLTASASAVAEQLDICADSVRQVKARRSPEPEDPFAPQDEDPYELVQAASLAPRDFRDWSLHDCQIWCQEWLTALAKGRLTALRHAVQHVVREHPRETWEACLAEAGRALEHEAEQKLAHWHCIQRAQTDPAVRQHLATLLRLDPIHRQAGLQPYLLSRHLQCAPAEVREVMAYIRYESVAARVLALVETPPLPLPSHALSPPPALPDV
jgi:hypothetical protein